MKRVGGGKFDVYKKDGSGWPWIIGIIIFLMIIGANADAAIMTVLL